MRRFFIGIALALSSDMALAETVCVNFSDAMSAHWHHFTAIALALMTILKPISWGLGVLANKTANTWDNRFAQGVSKATSYLAWFIGVFNLGNVPESVSVDPFSSPQAPGTPDK